MEEKMITIGVYADTAGDLFSYSEIMEDNWADITLPERIVRKWYEEKGLAEDTSVELRKPIEECTFEDWYYEVSCGDDTDGLYDFSVSNGFTPIVEGRSHDCNHMS